MAIEIINVGASPNDGNGDPIRDAFIKCNDNFEEVVPYTGATNDVNIGTNDLFTNKVFLYDEPNDNYGSVHYTDGNFHIEDSDNHKMLVIEDGFMQIHLTDTIQSNLFTSGLTATRDHYLPNESGTLALTSDIPNVSGTDNFVAKFSGTDSIENSLIFDDGSFVGVSTITPTTNLEVSGPDYSFSAGRQASNRKVSIGLNDNGQPSIQSFDSSNAPVNLTINPSGGNVGIGTLNPNYQTAGRLVVDINGSSQSLLGFSIGTNPSAYIASTSTLTELASVSNPLLFTVGSERMRITSAGNVGIGTSSPNEKLVVGGASGAATTPTAIRLDDTYRTGGDAFDKLKFYLYKSSTETYGFGLGDLGDIQYWAGTNSTGTHRFFTSQTERMRITSSGNVGIGTTSPVSKLHVAGNTYSEGLHIATGQFSQSGGIIAGFYTFSNVSVNKSFMITLRQSGNGVNNVVGMAFTFGAGGTAYNLGQDNTNPVLNLSLTLVGLVLTLTTGSGYGTTTWEYTITQIK